MSGKFEKCQQDNSNAKKNPENQKKIKKKENVP